MMAKASKDKGKRGERMWRDELRAAGFTACRGQQFAGSADSPDVVCEEMRLHFHAEVKFVEKLSLREAMRQAEADAGKDALPRIAYVAHKTSRAPWLVTLRGHDFLALARAFLADKTP